MLRPLSVALALAWMTAPLAEAHEQWTPNAVNRYVALAAIDDRLDVSLRLLYGELPGLELRREMDTDDDGQLSGAEVVRQRLAWARRSQQLLRLFVDDRPVKLELVAAVGTGGEPAVGAHPVEISLHGSVALPAGERRVRVELGEPLPRQGESEVGVDFDTGWRLQASARGAEAPARPPVQRFTFPPPSASPVTFVLRSTGLVAAPERRGPDGAVLVAAAVVAALAAAGAAWLLWRRRGRDA